MRMILPASFIKVLKSQGLSHIWFGRFRPFRMPQLSGTISAIDKWLSVSLWSGQSRQSALWTVEARCGVYRSAVTIVSCRVSACWSYSRYQIHTGAVYLRLARACRASGGHIREANVDYLSVVQAAPLSDMCDWRSPLVRGAPPASCSVSHCSGSVSSCSRPGGGGGSTVSLSVDRLLCGGFCLVRTTAVYTGNRWRATERSPGLAVLPFAVETRVLTVEYQDDSKLVWLPSCVWYIHLWFRHIFWPRKRSGILDTGVWTWHFLQILDPFWMKSGAARILDFFLFDRKMHLLLLNWFFGWQVT